MKKMLSVPSVFQTYVCEKPRKMSFSKMDPSCTFAFYLRSQRDLENLVTLTNNMVSGSISLGVLAVLLKKTKLNKLNKVCLGIQ